MGFCFSKRYTDNEKQLLIDQLFRAMVSKNQKDFTELITIHPFLVNINQNNEYYHPTPLSKTADMGLTSFVEELIIGGANLDTKSRKKWVTPIWRAARNGHKKIVKMLVDAGADVDIPSVHGSTPLMIAGYKGHLDCMRILINGNADVNLTDERGWTALDHCINTASTSPLKLLIEAGVNVDHVSNDGCTAYSRTTCETIRKYLEEKASAYKLDLKKRTVELLHILLPLFTWDVLWLVVNYSEADGADKYIACHSQRGSLSLIEPSPLKDESAQEALSKKTFSES
jgi:hypothetical protein